MTTYSLITAPISTPMQMTLQKPLRIVLDPYKKHWTIPRYCKTEFKGKNCGKKQKCIQLYRQNAEKL